MADYNHLKEQVLRCNLELAKSKLVVLTFGNVSAIDRRAGVIAIKPSGVAYAELTAEAIVIVDLDNRVVSESKNQKLLRPSSDTKTHLFLYKHFPDIGGVVHTHSAYATAWAQAGRPIPVLGTTHADLTAFDIPCTAGLTENQIQLDYETETGRLITETFKGLSHEDIPLVLVRGHGAFSWGATPEKAVYNSVMLEEVARLASLTLALNPAAPRLDPALIKKHYERKHGKDAYYGQS
jgi:L-ribulose-5-phosphate 4-epimerase